jgi:hypothetical protein
MGVRRSRLMSAAVVLILAAVPLGACGGNDSQPVETASRDLPKPKPPTTTWDPVDFCKDAPDNRPALLWVYFWHPLSHAETREAVAVAGRRVGYSEAPAYLDRLGPQAWTDFAQGSFSLEGVSAHLMRFVDELEKILPEDKRTMNVSLHCAGQQPTDTFDPDTLMVELPPGADIAALLARHGGLETEEARTELKPGGAVLFRLKTSRPDQLFERVHEWWRDPSTLTVTYDSLLVQ